MTPNPTQKDIDTALRSFITAIVPGIEVVRGQDNRVGQPRGTDHIVFWPLRRPRLATNIDTFDDPSNTLSVLTEVEIVMQLDVHGPNSADNAQAIRALFRDQYGVDAVNTSNAAVTPLYCDDPRQVPFVNAEQMVEYRWVLEAHLQANQALTLPQESATALGPIELIEADLDVPATSPPVSPWRAVATPSNADTLWVSVDYSPTLKMFAAVSSHNTAQAVMTSVDGGETWTLRNTPIIAGAQWQKIFWSQAANKWIVGGVNAILSSPDGINWTPHIPPTFGSSFAIAGNPTFAVACGYDQIIGPGSYKTTDAVNWQAAVPMPFFALDVCFLERSQSFCAVGNGPYVATAPANASAWTQQNGALSGNWHAVAASPTTNRICAPDYALNSMISDDDGVTWEYQSLPSAQVWNDIVWGNEFVIVSSGNAGEDAAISIDATDWKLEATPPGQWQGVCYAPDLKIYLAVSNFNNGNDVMIRSQ